MSITFSTCFYSVKSKFNSDKYYFWIKNLLNNVDKFNLVIYTDDINEDKIKKISNNNLKIKIINKPLESLYNYRYKNLWIKNQEKNIYLKNISWELQMIWAEKINFVFETSQNNYFANEFFGWIDIGYFRCNNNDIQYNQISKWPNEEKIKNLEIDKIHYGIVNNNTNFINYLKNIINNKNNLGLPETIIPHEQVSVAGGFFISHINKLNWWKNTFDEKLNLYFKNNYLVKDDQIILIDCIFSNFDEFKIYNENNPNFDNWFMFQRILL